jgi:maltose alpha-D-glucosyltransferase/alpha-amylase
VNEQQVRDGRAGSWAGLETFLGGEGREWLERDVLPAFIAGQRWFGGRTRGLRSTTITDVARLDVPDAVLMLVDATYENGAGETYVAPVVARPVAEADAASLPPAAIVGHLRGAMSDRVLYDGTFDADVLSELLKMIRLEHSLPTWRGQLTGHAGAHLSELAGSAADTLRPSRSGAEQSNTSVRYGDRLMLKLFRRPAAGTNPEREITEFLTDHARFPAIARYGGCLDYRPRGGQRMTVALLQAYVPNQGDGWTWTLARIQPLFEAANPAPDLESIDAPLVAQWLSGTPSAAMRAAAGAYQVAASRLGTRTAELHVALASGQGEDFAPELANRAGLVETAVAMRADGERALDSLAGHADRLASPIADLARHVLARRRQVLSVFDDVPNLGSPIPRTRIHGDYHLGQVLVAGDDFVIVDFEGEPARPLAERRARQSPVKDVAGMLRSFSYAADVARRRAARNGDPRVGDQGRGGHLARAKLWEVASGGAFLRSYLATAEGTGILPGSRRDVETILRVYLLDKALYELQYELDNRPDWVDIPLRGVLGLG